MYIHVLYIVYVVILYVVENLILKKNNHKLFIIGSILGIVLIQGLRADTVGIDLTAYLPAYENVKKINIFSDELKNFERGYIIFSGIFSKLNVNKQIYLTIVSFLSITPIYLMIYKNSKNPLVSILIFILFVFYIFTFSSLRQSLALGMTCFSLKYIKEKKIVKFCLIVLLASTFHLSALVFLLAYPMYYSKLDSKYLFFIIFAFIICLLFRNQIFVFLSKLYKGEEINIEETNAYMTLIVFAGIVILSYIFDSKKDGKTSSIRNLIVIATFLQIFSSVSNVAMRAGMYYSIYITILIPNLIEEQRDKKIKYVAYPIVIMIFSYTFIKNMMSNYLNVADYSFFWNK